MVTVETLIRKQQNDIAGFRRSISPLIGKPGTRQFIGDLERRATEAERAIAVLKAHRC
jgi:hypothetical protein